MKNNKRNQQEQMINEAKAYFDACGMSETLEAFFTKPSVKELVHTKYAEFENDVNGIANDIDQGDLPEPIIQRVRAMVEAITGEEASYLENVKCSMLCSLHNLFQVMETFVTIDEVVTEPFKEAFGCDDNEKVMKILGEIADGVIGKMMDKCIKMLCIPAGLPEELIDIMMLISGGMPMMNLSEMEKMFGDHEEDDDDDEEDEEM